MDVNTAYNLMMLVNGIVILLAGTIAYCIGWAIYNGVKTLFLWKKREREFYEETMDRFNSGEWRRIDDGPKT